MTKRINLSWEADGSIEYFNIYRDIISMNINALPEVFATTTSNAYADINIIDDQKYFYIVESVRNGLSKISDQISCVASFGVDQFNAFVSDGSTSEVVLSLNNTVCTIPKNNDAPRGWFKSKFNKPRAASNGSFYFEVKVLIAGSFALGIANESTDTGTWSGGSDNAGDGGRIQIFASGQVRKDGTYKSFTSPLKVEDRVGIGLSSTIGSPSQATMGVYINDIFIGNAYTDLIASQKYEPHFCFYLNSVNESVAIKVVEKVKIPNGFQVW